MNRVLEVDEADGYVETEPGVLNQDLRDHVRRHDLWYAPDPASKEFCSIGGNVSTNAGGLCCVKYGVTRDSVLALEVVLAHAEGYVEVWVGTVAGPRIDLVDPPVPVLPDPERALAGFGVVLRGERCRSLRQVGRVHLPMPRSDPRFAHRSWRPGLRVDPGQRRLGDIHDLGGGAIVDGQLLDPPAVRPGRCHPPGR